MKSRTVAALVAAGALLAGCDWYERRSFDSAMAEFIKTAKTDDERATLENMRRQAGSASAKDRAELIEVMTQKRKLEALSDAMKETEQKRDAGTIKYGYPTERNGSPR